MKTRAAFLCILLLPGALLGCSKTKVTRGPDGLFRFHCGRGMKDCVAQAEKYCNVQKKDGGYVIVSGTSRKIMMGAENGQYRTAAEVADLEVQCGAEEVEEIPKHTFPTRRDRDTEEEPIGEEPVMATVPVAAAAVCTKGATQACVGPGACQGGQVCLADGSGFGPCDCGQRQQGLQPAAPPTTAPAVPVGPAAEPLR